MIQKLRICIAGSFCIFFFHISNVSISRVSRFVILELQVVVYCLPFSSSRLLTY